MRIAVVMAVLVCACAQADLRYEVDSDWRQVDPGLRERYAEFFTVIFDDSEAREPDLRPLRSDIERTPVDARNFEALRAVAIAYFELNYRAETQTADGMYLGNSFRAAHLAAVPWKAYGLVDDAGLRDAILDFFQDVATGEKPGSERTAHRLAGIVESLEKKEGDPARRERIDRIGAELRARSQP